MLWDTAGQEKFRTITRTYFKGAHGAVIVYDITNRSSYSNIHSWIEEIDKYAALGITKLLIGNKCDDQMNRKVTYEEGTEISNMYKMNFIETSAKSNTNIKEAFNTLTQLMYDTETHIGGNSKRTTNAISKGVKLKSKNAKSKDEKKKK